MITVGPDVAVNVSPWSVTTGAALGAVATLVGAGVPVYIRYVRGSKSRVSFSRFETMDDSEWRDGSHKDLPVWTRICVIRASNDGWRDGIISQGSLDEVVLFGDFGRETVKNPERGVHRIVLKHHSTDGDGTRLTLTNPQRRGGQIIGGRDDEMLSVIPFILQESELGQKMKASDEGVFTFSLTIEDNKRVYRKSVEVRTSLDDSAGGKLQKEG